MAIGVFKLNEAQRNRLSVAFNALNFIQIILGLSITSYSIFIYLNVAPILFSERSEVDFVFIVTGIYGTHVILHYLAGIKICHKCLNQPHKKSTPNIFILWTCAGANIIINFIIISVSLKKISKHIIKSMKHSLHYGIQNYLCDASWKKTIDKLQYELECCGIDSYEDWYEIEWLNKYQYDKTSDVISKLKSRSDKNYLQILPWSCCKINFPMQCLHDPIQQKESSHIWIDEPTLILSSINSNGCLKKLRLPIEKAVITFIVTTVLIILVQITIFLIARIMYTSSRNALLMGSPHGTAPGWIFGRGDCGYTGGKSIAEIMAEGNTTATVTTESSAPESETKEGSSIKSKFKKPYETFKRKINERKKKKEENPPDPNEVPRKSRRLKRIRSKKIKVTSVPPSDQENV